jgi:hypothetical protein
VLFIPAGRYRLNAALLPRDKVSIRGAGVEATTLLPYGGISAIQRIGTSTDLLRNCTFSDMTIDGANQTGTILQSTSRKGFYIVYAERITWERLRIINTGGTGLGSDFLPDCVIDTVIAENCGRLNTDGTAGGCAGIGIGTGQWSYEPLIVRNCITRNNKKAGLFFETQSGLLVGGIKVSGHYSEGNGGHGIADAGCNGLEIEGGTSRTNTGAGFALYAGTVGASIPGTNTKVTGLECVNNGLDGFLVDGSVAASAGQLRFDGITARNNQRSGVSLQPGTASLSHVRIRNADCRLNSYSGLHVQATGAAVVNDLLVEGGSFTDNGQVSGASHRDGIRISSPIVRATIRHNRCGNTSGTPTQQNGIFVNTTTTDCLIEDNDVRVNVASATNFGGATFVTTRVRRNVGYNPQGPLATTVAASPWTYQAGRAPEVLHLKGGTVTDVAKAGTSLGTPLAIPLEPLESVVVTYSSAPTAVADRR